MFFKPRFDLYSVMLKQILCLTRIFYAYAHVPTAGSTFGAPNRLLRVVPKIPMTLTTITLDQFCLFLNFIDGETYTVYLFVSGF